MCVGTVLFLLTGKKVHCPGRKTNSPFVLIGGSVASRVPPYTASVWEPDSEVTALFFPSLGNVVQHPCIVHS